MNLIDLQIQTTASDGKHTPAECVAMAKQNGVHTIAITDHDTVAGVAEAMAAGQELGVRVIPGIEMSVEDHGLHLLGYGIDTGYERLGSALKRFEEGRIAAAKDMVWNLQQAGFVVEWEDVLGQATGAVIARPHIAAAVLKRPENREKLGGITRKGDFIGAFLANDNPAYVHRRTISAADAIVLLHEAGGVSIWSHPPIPDFVGNCAGMGDFLKELVGYGLEGLELLSPSHTEADVACLEKLAGEHGLLVTAGSDFHEAYDPTDVPLPRPATTIGDYPTYGRSLEGILERLDRAIIEPRKVAS